MFQKPKLNLCFECDGKGGWLREEVEEIKIDGHYDHISHYDFITCQECSGRGYLTKDDISYEWAIRHWNK